VEALMETADNHRPAPRRPSDLTAIFRPAAERIRLDGVEEVLQTVASIASEIEEQPGEQDARHPPKMRRSIRLVPGGYDVAQVDSLLNRAEHAVVAGGEVRRAWARQALRSTALARRPLGYARGPVHSLLEELGRQLGAG
jgi:hypothetical protein